MFFVNVLCATLHSSNLSDTVRNLKNWPKPPYFPNTTWQTVLQSAVMCERGRKELSVWLSKRRLSTGICIFYTHRGHASTVVTWCTHMFSFIRSYIVLAGTLSLLPFLKFAFGKQKCHLDPHFTVTLVFIKLHDSTASLYMSVPSFPFFISLIVCLFLLIFSLLLFSSSSLGAGLLHCSSLFQRRMKTPCCWDPLLMSICPSSWPMIWSYLRCERVELLLSWLMERYTSSDVSPR